MSTIHPSKTKSNRHNSDDDDDDDNTSAAATNNPDVIVVEQPFDYYYCCTTSSWLTNTCRPRILYFSTFIWISVCGGRFLAPFLENACSMSATQIGIALSVQQVASTVFGTVGGKWADERQRKYANNSNSNNGRAHVMAIGIISGTLIFLLHGVVPTPSSSSSAADTTNSTINNEEVVDVDDHDVLPPTATITPDFLWHVALRVAYAISSSLVSPVLDGMTVDYLKKNKTNKQSTDSSSSSGSNNNDENKNEKGGDSDDYGKERLFGAISWAISNLGLSVLLDVYGFWVTFPLTILSGLFVLLTLFLFTRTTTTTKQYRALQKRSSNVIKPNDDSSYTSVGSNNSSNGDVDLEEEGTTKEMRIPQSLDADHDIEEEGATTVTVTAEEPIYTTTEPEKNQQRQPLSLLALLRLMISSPGAISFLLCLFCLSIGTILVESLIFLYFEFLGGSYTSMGLTVVLTVVFEIPIFHLAPKLLEKWGKSIMMLVAAGCYVIRVIGYSSVPNGHMLYVLLLEPLHGITYACSQTAIVAFAAAAVPAPGYEASAQALLQWFKGCGSTLGLLLGGIVEDVIGPRFLYRIAAGVVTAGAAILIINKSAPCNNKRYGPLPSKKQKPMNKEEGDVELTETFEGSDSDSEGIILY